MRISTEWRCDKINILGYITNLIHSRYNVYLHVSHSFWKMSKNNNIWRNTENRIFWGGTILKITPISICFMATQKTFFQTSFSILRFFTGFYEGTNLFFQSSSLRLIFLLWSITKNNSVEDRKRNFRVFLYIHFIPICCFFSVFFILIHFTLFLHYTRKLLFVK